MLTDRQHFLIGAITSFRGQDGPKSIAFREIRDLVDVIDHLIASEKILTDLSDELLEDMGNVERSIDEQHARRNYWRERIDALIGGVT